MSQEFDNNVLDLVKQKQFYPYKYMRDFEKFKEKLPRKKKFYRSLTGKQKRVTKNMDMFLKLRTNFNPQFDTTVVFRKMYLLKRG